MRVNLEMRLYSSCYELAKTAGNTTTLSCTGETPNVVTHRPKLDSIRRIELSSAGRSPANVLRTLANRELADLEAEFFISAQRPTTLKEVLTRDVRVYSPLDLYDELESRLA